MISDKKYDVTKHAKLRTQQRMKLADTKEIPKIFEQAIMNGKNLYDYNGNFYKHLFKNLWRHRNIPNLKSKVYLDKIFIYTDVNKKRKLITTLNVDEQFLPTEQYLIK